MRSDDSNVHGHNDDPSGKRGTVRCDDVVVELSARLDGEPLSMPAALVDAHVAGCPACTGFLLGASKLHRSVRLRPAERIPDLATAVLAAAPARGYRLFARYALLVVSLTILILAVPALALGVDGHLPAHIARHLGAFDVAIAVGMLGAAWRPVRARPFLPVAGALALAMLVTAIIDASDGTTPILGEAHHVLELTGLGLVWALAGFPLPQLRRSSLRFAP